jgi:hypothetical protein
MAGPYSTFQDIPQFPSWGAYQIDVAWNQVEFHLGDLAKSLNVDLSPDFQRGHVWTREQQISFVEFVLSGGKSGRDILWNCPSWHKPSNDKDTIVLVDGKQRLQAVREFMADRLPAFGSLHREFGGRLRGTMVRFSWHVNDLPTKRDVLEWYLALNSGGTVHTDDELNRVRGMLNAEVARSRVDDGSGVLRP